MQSNSGAILYCFIDWKEDLNWGGDVSEAGGLWSLSRLPTELTSLYPGQVFPFPSF